jgi:histidinol-phosphate aminotransferase
MSWRDRVREELGPLSPYHVPPVTVAVKLDANESPYAPPPALLEALAEEVRAAPLHRYPDPRAIALRALVAADLRQAPERLVLGNGGDELIGLLCSTFARPRPGQARAVVAYPAPAFAVFRTAAAAAGMDVVEAPLGPRFEPDEAALAGALARTPPSVVFLTTPNNPTGTVWPRAAVERIVAAHPDAIVVVDQAYGAYGGEDLRDLVDAHPHCVLLRTYSKVGLAGLRVGVLVAQPEVAHEVEKVRPPYNIDVLTQRAAVLVLGRFRASLEAHVAEVVAERERLGRALAAMAGVEVFPSGANLVLVRVGDAGRVWQGLLERSVLVRNLDRPGALAGCLRVTVGRPEENERFLAALREVLAGG